MSEDQLHCQICKQPIKFNGSYNQWFHEDGTSTYLGKCKPPVKAMDNQAMSKAPKTRSEEIRAGIYIASKTKHAQKWKDLRAFGIPIISTWIDESGEGETKSYEDLWKRCIGEASNAERLIVYAEPGDELKGGLVEVGAALAGGTPVFVVGEIEALKTAKNHILMRKAASIEAACTAPCPRRNGLLEINAELLAALELADILPPLSNMEREELEALREGEKELLAALEKFGQHDDDCDVLDLMVKSKPCNCGLVAAIARAKGQRQ